ncbi:hypothetical protein BC835DRAFT_1352482 [Cytidiella melzeri]|nr:hypothetical protein BC835DRAFT_1352482 [Cytidiella melzeri]
MRLIKRFGLYTFLSFSFVSSTCALSGDSWCGTLMCVDATVNESTVTYELKALNQLGWMSIGFGPQMAGTPLVIMWSNEDGSVYLSQRMANGQVPPQLDPNPPRIASISASVNLSSDTTPILAFDIPYQNDTTQSLIWAFGVTRPPPDSNSDIEQHLDAGAFSLDLSKNRGGGGGDDDPRTSSAPENTSTLVASSTTFVSTPVPSSSEGASLTSTPVVSTSPSALSSPSALPQDALPQIQPPLPPPSQSDNLHAVLVAHAVFSFLGFCVCLPLAAIFTRWYRTVRPYWLRVHWSIIAFLAIPLGTIGWALGPVVVALRGRRHVVNEHQICGVILFALCLVQAAFGVLIHRRQPKHGRIHPSRNVVHVILGLVIIGLSFYETKTGLTRDAMLSVALRRGLIIGCVIFAAVSDFFPDSPRWRLIDRVPGVRTQWS